VHLNIIPVNLTLRDYVASVTYLKGSARPQMAFKR